MKQRKIHPTIKKIKGRKKYYSSSYLASSRNIKSKCYDLIQNLRRARLENRLEDRLKHYSKYKALFPIRG